MVSDTQQTSSPRARRSRVRSGLPRRRDLKPFPRPTRRFSTGLILAGILVLMSLFWYQRQIHPRLKSLLGADDGALLSTLVAASAATYGLFKPQVDDVLKRILSLLDRPYAPKILGGGMVVMGLLLFGTSSIYVTLNKTGNASAKADFELELRKNGREIESAVNLSIDKPYFRLFWFSPGAVVFRLHKPSGFATERRTLGLGSTLRLDLPSDLHPKELHVLRLVPIGLISRTRADEDLSCQPKGRTPAFYLDIDVRRGKSHWSYCVPLRPQPIYIGGSRSDLEAVALGENSGQWLSHLKTKIGLLDEDTDAQLQETAESPPLYLGTVEFLPGDEVCISRRFFDGYKADKKAMGTFTVLNNPGPQTFLLEEAP
jgi:hypothetical protein